MADRTMCKLCRKAPKHLKGYCEGCVFSIIRAMEHEFARHDASRPLVNTVFMARCEACHTPLLTIPVGDTGGVEEREDGSATYAVAVRVAPNVQGGCQKCREAFVSVSVSRRPVIR